MKKKALLCATVIAMSGALAMSAIAMIRTDNHDKSQVENASETAIYPHEGMYFEVDYVVETFGYGDEAWYMVYNNPDAGMNYEVIRITKSTHDLIVKRQNMRWMLTGTLHAQKDYESVEYALTADSNEIMYQF